MESNHQPFGRAGFQDLLRTTTPYLPAENTSIELEAFRLVTISSRTQSPSWIILYASIVYRVEDFLDYFRSRTE